MIELPTLYSLYEFSTRIWINDMLFSHPIFLKPLGLDKLKPLQHAINAGTLI